MSETLPITDARERRIAAQTVKLHLAWIVRARMNETGITVQQLSTLTGEPTPRIDNLLAARVVPLGLAAELMCAMGRQIYLEPRTPQGGS